MKLGVNIDHIAVLREARRVDDPNILDALGIVKRAGADQITIHLREDRRHINDIDTKNIIEFSKLPVNLECSTDIEILDIVLKLRPHRATLVPEKREEITTEGGLNISKEFDTLDGIIKLLKKRGIEASLFIDPTFENIKVAKSLGVEWIEFHTGKYANIYAMLNENLSKTPYSIKDLELPRTTLKSMLEKELANLHKLSHEAMRTGIKVACGHGLNYQNVKSIAKISSIQELNIGQSIIARSIWVGLERAIVEMRELIK
jgi:pyridoxine 5-phosphate synthase